MNQLEKIGLNNLNDLHYQIISLRGQIAQCEKKDMEIVSTWGDAMPEARNDNRRKFDALCKEVAEADFKYVTIYKALTETI